jgi:hypothetical protein
LDAGSIPASSTNYKENNMKNRNSKRWRAEGQYSKNRRKPGNVKGRKDDANHKEAMFEHKEYQCPID